jgi:hypothetical protein
VAGAGDPTPELTDPEMGLDLSRPDSWTAEEEDAYRRRYAELKGTTMPGHDFWLQRGRPDVFKRYRRQAVLMSAGASVEPADQRKLSHLCYLHQYAIVGFEDGIAYQTHAAQRLGVQRRELLAVFALAFLHAGPLGMRFVATSVDEVIADYEDPPPSPWPVGWAPDAAAFRTGVSFGDPRLTSDELVSIRAWWSRTCGSVPPFVDVLGRHQPSVLKAFQDRFEHAVGDDLPKQLVPLMLLQWHLVAGRGEAAARYVTMARTFGVERRLVLDGVARAVLYVGVDAVGSDVEPLAVALDEWPVDEVPLPYLPARQ